MAEQNNINYEGPDREYEAHPGDIVSRPSEPFFASRDGYYDLTLLEERLDQIIKEAELIQQNAEADLQKYTLGITTDKLREAQSAVWPAELGVPKDYITYKQYKVLSEQSDRGSKYIAQEYSKAIRSESGTGSFDVLKMSSVIKNEAQQIKGFLDGYIGQVDDSAEHRTLELFQDWAASTLQHTGRLRSYYAEGAKADTSQIPESEMASVTPSDAREYQALFKVKVNALNTDLDRSMSDLEKRYLNSSDIFYNKFLGPALKFRLDIGKNLEFKADPNTMLGNELRNASESLDINMNVGLADLMHRNQAFDQKLKEIEQKVGTRDSLKDIITQLSAKSGVNPATFIDAEGSPDDDEFFVKLAAISDVSDENQFLSSHNYLSGRDEDDAHSQYVLKKGDTITGDLNAEDGVLIDGIDVSDHAHTGEDGSAKISGADLIPRTLRTFTIDTTEPVGMPENLRMISLDIASSISSGTLVSARLGWDTPNDGYIHEVQVVPVVTAPAPPPSEWLVTTIDITPSYNTIAGGSNTTVGGPDVVPGDPDPDITCPCVAVSGDPATGGGWTDGSIDIGVQDTWYHIEAIGMVDASTSGEGDWWKFDNGDIVLLHDVEGLSTDYIADVSDGGSGSKYVAVIVNGNTTPLSGTAGVAGHISPPSGNYPAGTKFSIYGQVISGPVTTIWPAWTFLISCHRVCAESLTFRTTSVSARTIGTSDKMWQTGATYGNDTRISASVTWATENNVGTAYSPGGPPRYTDSAAAGTDFFTGHHVEIQTAGTYQISFRLNQEYMEAHYPDISGSSPPEFWWIEWGVWDAATGLWRTTSTCTNPAAPPPTYQQRGVAHTDLYERLDPQEAWQMNDLSSWSNTGVFTAGSWNLSPGDKIVVGYGSTFNVSGMEADWVLTKTA